MFNNNVTTILKMMNSFTDKAVLKYPVTVLNSEVSDIMIRIDMSVLDSESFEDCGIWELGSFLGVFGLYGEERTVKRENNFLVISDSSSISSTKLSDIDMLIDYDKSPTVFDGTRNADSVAIFKLSKDDMKKIKSATGVFKTLTDLNIQSQDSELTLQLALNSSFNVTSSSFSVRLPGDLTIEFKTSIPVANFMKIPLSNYDVFIKYNPAAGKYRIFMQSTEIAGVEIIMSCTAL